MADEVMQIVYVQKTTDLYDQDLIAFGTGGFAKRFLPVLANNTNIRLYGVTNSRIMEADAGKFLDTRLVKRSLKTWMSLLPDAAVYLAVYADYPNVNEVYEVCQVAGVKKLLLPTFGYIEALMNYEQNTKTVWEMYEEPTMLLGANPILRLCCMANEIRDVHKASFAEFRGCHKDQTVAVVGTGPTLSYYTQIGDVPHIGTNACCIKENLKLDYFFQFHYVPQWAEAVRKLDCVKFFGINTFLEVDDKFPVGYVEECGARRFFHGAPSKIIQTNIEYYPLMNFASTIFQALHFAIHTRPKRILLVGCDCTSTGHFYDKGLPNYWREEASAKEWLDGYGRVKEFMRQYYPDTEIVSVNPVGLKGMFRDVYTESYLDAHPEIDRTAVEILNPEEFVN